MISCSLSGGPIIYTCIQERAVASWSLSEELTGPASSLGVSGVNYLCLFHIQVLLQLYINIDPPSLKEAPAHMNRRQSAQRRMAPSAIFNPLILSQKDTSNTCNVWVGIRAETHGPLAAFITVWPWDCVGSSSAPMTQLAFLCASLQTDFCQTRAKVLSLFIKAASCDNKNSFVCSSYKFTGQCFFGQHVQNCRAEQPIAWILISLPQNNAY